MMAFTLVFEGDIRGNANPMTTEQPATTQLQQDGEAHGA